MVKLKFSLEEVISFSRSYALRKSPKATRILDLCVNKSKRDYLNLCFAYLRFVDDLIDNPNTPIYEKREFVENQKKLISLCFKEEYSKLSPETIEEAALLYFSEYALSSNNKILLNGIEDMVNALNMDVRRLEDSGVFSNSEFDNYIKLMSTSLYKILSTFLSTDSKHLDEEFYLMLFTANAQIIRDFEEDIDTGFINISKEDVEKYKLDLSNLKIDKNFSTWLNDRVKYSWEIMYKETARLKYLPLKFRFFIYYSMIYYLTWVVRAKVYGYNIQSLSKKTFLGEVKTYFISFLKSIDIFFRGFIFISKKEEVKINVLNNKHSRSITFKEAVKKSRRNTLKRAPKLWLISHLLFSREKRKYVYLCFSYLRWIDDFVDNPFNNGKVEFIENQLNLINNLTKSDSEEFRPIKERLEHPEEIFLSYCVDYAKSICNYNLIYEGRRNIEAMKMDALRLGCRGLFSNEELDRYIEKLVSPIFNLSCYLFFPSIKIRNNDKYLGKFLQYVLMLRDFDEDLNSGYINLTREEIDKYHLDINNLENDKNRFNWARDKYYESIKILNEEINIFRSLPLKLKLFWSPIYPYMIFELNKIKFYDFDFGTKKRKIFFKELKIFFASVSLTLKVYKSIFLGRENLEALKFDFDTKF